MPLQKFKQTETPFIFGVPFLCFKHGKQYTAKKLGVSIYHYMQDRLSGAMKMPSLASEVARLAAELRQDKSWGECAAPG